VVRGILA